MSTVSISAYAVCERLEAHGKVPVLTAADRSHDGQTGVATAHRLGQIERAFKNHTVRNDAALTPRPKRMLFKRR